MENLHLWVPFIGVIGMAVYTGYDYLRFKSQREQEQQEIEDAIEKLRAYEAEKKARASSSDGLESE